MGKIAIGKIINTCGLKGEVKISNMSDFINERYKKGNVVNISGDNFNQDYTISSYRQNDKFIYVKFKEINSIEEAEQLKNTYMYIDSDNLKRINEDTFYYYELLNMEVYYNSKLIGKISEISNNTRQDLIRVDNSNSSFLVPFIDEFIELIDVNNKKIVLKNLEGLV